MDKIKKKDFSSKEEFISFLEGQSVNFAVGSESVPSLKATRDFLERRISYLFLMSIWDQEYHYNWLSEKDERTYFVEINKNKVQELVDGDWMDVLPFLGAENYSPLNPAGTYLTVDVVWEKRKEFYKLMKEKYVLPIRKQLEEVYPQEQYTDDY